MSQEKYFQSNEAINHPDNDLFNFKPYASKVQESIRNSCFSDEPIIFGVYGKWGEGKTSFMNLIFRNLESGVGEKAKKIIKYRFNPWRYQSEDMLLIQFFKGLIKVINSDYGTSPSKSILIDKLSKYVSAILAGTSVEIETGVNLGFKATVKAKYNFKDTFEKLEDDNNESIESQKDEIDEILKNHQFRIVIFLDDIDRLNKNELYLVFRLLKLIASFKNLTYIIALDDEMVAKAIYNNYGDEINDGKLFLEKIVNIPISLPKVDPFDILKEFKRKLKAIFLINKIEINELSSKSIHDYNTGTNRFFNEIEGIEKHIKTPRMLYRLLNSFTTNLIALNEEVNYADLLWLEFLKIKYLKVYNYIKNNPNYFIKHGTIEGYFYDSRKTIFNEELEQMINDSSDLKKNYKYISLIINYLFPLFKDKNVVSSYISNLEDSYKVKMDLDLSLTERRINHSEYFKTYFNYHTIGKISNLELDQLLQLIYAQDNKLDEQFKNFIAKNDNGKFVYETLNKLKLVEQNQNRYTLINFLLTHINSLVEDNDTKDVFSRTQRNQLVQDLFRNTAPLNDKEIDTLIDSFIKTASILDILYLRRGVLNKEFEGTDRQKLIDSCIIKKVNKEYSDFPFFENFEGFVSRAIFSLWEKLNPNEFKEYIIKHLSSSTIKNFINCFPTLWGGSEGKHLDDFKVENYNFLKSLINPKIIADIIEKSFSEELKKEEYLNDKIWFHIENKKELTLLAQFMYHYKKDKEKLLLLLK